MPKDAGRDESSRPRRGPGRRGGKSDLRADIVREASAQFAKRGYDATSYASIARAVGVDPTLITHYFGSKEQLFAATLESLSGAFARMGEAFLGGREGLGRRMAEAYFANWESETIRPQLLSLLRSASTNERARDVFVAAMQAGPLREARSALPAEVVERIPLATSQLIGLAFSRYVLEAPSIVSQTPEQLIDAITPALEHILG